MGSDFIWVQGTLNPALLVTVIIVSLCLLGELSHLRGDLTDCKTGNVRLSSAFQCPVLAAVYCKTFTTSTNVEIFDQF